jgi:hypothetical protein
MRSFGIELTDEGIEAFLLLQAIGARRAGCFLLEGEVHSLMTPILLRMAGFDAFDGDTEPKPPDQDLSRGDQKAFRWTKLTPPLYSPFGCGTFRARSFGRMNGWMTNQMLSDVFAWLAVAAPAILGIVNAIRQTSRLAIFAPLFIALIAGIGLHYRNVVSAEKDQLVDNLRGRTISADQAAKLKAALAGASGNVGFNTIMFEAESRHYADLPARSGPDR